MIVDDQDSDRGEGCHRPPLYGAAAAISRAAAALALLLLAPAALAQRADVLTPLPALKFQSWSEEEDAPPGVSVVQQVASGYLWVGTETGLFRFDGIRFERLPQYERKGGAGVMDIAAGPSGETWLLYGDGHIGLVRDGRIAFPQPEDMRKRARAIGVARDGTFWTVNSEFLFRFRAGRWHRFRLPERYHFLGMTVARDGRIWLVGQSELLVVDADAARFRVVKPLRGIAAIAEAPDGAMWLTETGKLWRLAPGAAPAATAPPIDLGPDFKGAQLSFDHTGALWVVPNGRTLLRFPADRLRPGGLRAEAGQRFALPATAPAFAAAGRDDREGSIWLATSTGLARFRPVSFLDRSATGPIADAPAGAWAPQQVLQDGRGTIYLRKGERVFRADPGGVLTAIDVPPMLSPYDLPCGAAEGGFWWRTARAGLRRIDGPAPAALTVPGIRGPGAPAPFACAQAPNGTLWVSFSAPEQGLRWRDRAGWHWTASDRRSPSYTGMALATDRAGHALNYVGYGDTMRLGGPRAGLIFDPRANPLAFVEVFYTGPRYTLIGGETGLAMLQGDRIRTLSTERYPFLQDVSGIAQTAAGVTWLLGKAGLTRIDTAALERRFADPRAPLYWRTYGQEDGLLGVSESFGFGNLFEAKDGVLWMATNKGLFSFDPRHPVRNPVAPPVVIRQILVGERSYPAAAAVTLPMGTTNLQIDFTALSLVSPRRVAFRYRLLGSASEAWVDPGQRRQAIYTNLAPGTYRFQVIAANNDGVWNRDGATIALTIPPTFLQSMTFKILCGVALLAAAWGAYALRVRRISQRLRLAADVRERERQRIARELHDTMLQDMQGLILSFHNAAQTLPPEDAGRAALLKGRDQARDALELGRARVQMLRRRNEDIDPAALVRALAEKLIDRQAPRWTLVTRGEPRCVPAEQVEEIEGILGEAMLNAVRHARATTIALSIDYRAAEIVIACHDDGTGFPPEMLHDTGPAGHFGLIGMRERAAAAGIALSIGNAPQGGAAITLRIPARRG